MKPDSPTAAIVAALRKAGASVEHHEGSAGSPDLVWGFRGRMGFAEIKAPGKEHGVCGCTDIIASSCNAKSVRDGDVCPCSGHPTNGKPVNLERKVWHRQLAWHEAWRGPKVSVWTTVEQALTEVLGVLLPAGAKYISSSPDGQIIAYEDAK